MAEHDLSQMMSGYWISQAVYVAAKLGIADLIHEQPQAADALAAETDTHGPSLYRLLRALASVGVFVEDDEGRFANTPLGERLRSDVPGSQRAMAIMMGEEHYHCWGELLYSVQTGEKAFDKIYGMPIFEFLSQNPEQAKTFDAAMTGIHGRETAAVLGVFDFSGVETLADIGGGNGSQLIAVLEKNPNLKGILFDLPGVIERSRGALAVANVVDRCQAVGGDFFEAVPEGADVYLLRHIIHDWNDEQALGILRNCRRAIGAGGRLLVIESVIPPGNDPCFGKLLDLTMLVMPGGKERTAEEYRQLLADANFRLAEVLDTPADVNVIVAEPV